MRIGFDRGFPASALGVVRTPERDGFAWGELAARVNRGPGGKVQHSWWTYRSQSMQVTTLSPGA